MFKHSSRMSVEEKETKNNRYAYHCESRKQFGRGGRCFEFSPAHVQPPPRQTVTVFVRFSV